MSNIVINNPPKVEKEKLSSLRAGKFYVDSRGHLVFVGAVDSDTKVTGSDEDYDPRKNGGTSVIAIGSPFNGIALMGLLRDVGDYEEVDVEINIKRRD